MTRIVRRPVIEADPLRIRVRGLGKIYRLYDSLWARFADLAMPHRRGPGREIETLCDVEVELRRGESVGVMGPNGAGKTTLLRILTGALFPTSGDLEVRGRVTLLDLGGGFQPEISGRDNLLRLEGLEFDRVRAGLDRGVDQAGGQIGVAIVIDAGLRDHEAMSCSDRHAADFEFVGSLCILK